MTPQRWAQVLELFDACLNRPEAEWSELLNRRCAGDNALRREVEELLRADRDADDDFLPRRIGGGAAAFQETSTGWPPGSRFGPYRLLEPIARGGTSTVYLAARADDEFRQQVAVKILRRELTSPALLTRFRAERQILADLEHPHIARLLDGGTTAEGVPYLVMEHIRGLPLDAYCRDHRLGVEERLRLFLEVCGAVDHAHRHLVIHRDLKPSNILVTDEGTVKLVDFGIAKPMPGADAGSPLTTATGERLLTPTYASPEQLRGDTVTTATDVFALGLVLYELLSGHRPFGDGPLPAGELTRRICEDTPPPPSQAVREAGEEGTRHSGRSPTLSQDLDAIVLMALRKEPERRYPSARELAEDLRRYLAGRPIRAQPDSWRYRGGKFLRRHRRALTTAAALLLVLLAAGAYALRQELQATRAREQAAQTSALLGDILDLADPAAAGAPTVDAAALLDRARRRLEAQGDPTSGLRTELLLTLGDGYRKLGRLEAADAALGEALAKLREDLGDAHPSTLAGFHTLGHLRRDQGETAASEELLRLALDGRRAVLGADHPATLRTLVELALTLHADGRFDESETLLTEALEGRRRTLGPSHPEVAETLHHLGDLRHDQGRYEEAQPLFEEALELRRTHLGPSHAAVAETLNALSLLHLDRGEYEPAEAGGRQALAVRREVFGEGHPQTLQSQHNLASVLFARQDIAAARTLFEQVAQARRQLLGEEHPATVATLSTLAQVLQTDGELQAAETLLREILAIDQRRLPPDHPDLATDLHNLAWALERQDRLAEAEPLYRRAADLYRKALSDDHPYLALPLTALGAILHRQGRHQEAEPLLREALTIRRTTLPPDDWRTALTAGHLGATLIALGRSAEGRALLEESHRVLEQVLGADHRLTREAEERLAGNPVSASAGPR